MQKILIKILFLIFFADLVIIGWKLTRKSNSSKVLSFFTQATPTTTPTLAPTRIPTLTPSPSPIPSPTPTPIPQPQFSQEQIHGFIERFAGQYAVDPNVLRHIATCESGFNASAVNGPYIGLYQFGASAWQNNRLIMGEDPDLSLRFNAEESVQTAAYIISIGKKGLWPNCFP